MEPQTIRIYFKEVVQALSSLCFTNQNTAKGILPIRSQLFWTLHSSAPQLVILLTLSMLKKLCLLDTLFSSPLDIKHCPWNVTCARVCRTYKQEAGSPDNQIPGFCPSSALLRRTQRFAHMIYFRPHVNRVGNHLHKSVGGVRAIPPFYTWGRKQILCPKRCVPFRKSDYTMD